MICHQCQTSEVAYKTEVLETRERWSEDNQETYVFRRRKCLACEFIFNTIELRADDE